MFLIEVMIPRNGGRKKFSEKWQDIGGRDDLGQKLLMLNALERTRNLNDKGQSNKAVDILLKCIGQFPDNIKPYYILAEILIDAKQFKDALDVLNEMPPEIQDMNKVVLIGYCKEGMEYYDEAESCARQSPSIEPEECTGSKPQRHFSV